MAETNLQETLIASATAFLTSPAGKGIVTKLAEKSGVEDAKALVEDAKAVRELVNENTPVIKNQESTKNRNRNRKTRQ